MIKHTIDKETKIIIIETDFDFQEFKVEKFRQYFHLDFKIDKLRSSGKALFFQDFGGRKYYPAEIKAQFVNTDKRKVELLYSL